MKFQVEFYYDPKGKMPAKQYFDASDHQVRVKLLALVKYMAEYGRIFDHSKFRLVDKNDKIYEFKPKDGRFFNFFYRDKRIIITNACRKSVEKVDQKAPRRAITSKRDYEQRIKEGGYYD